MDGQDQPRIYSIGDHTLEVLMHPDVLELHAVRVVHTPHGDERQLHLKVRVRCGQKELVKPVRTPVATFGSLGVCIYVPASRHWLISYSPIHLT